MRGARKFSSAALPQLKNDPFSIQGRELVLKGSCSMVGSLAWAIEYFL